MPEYIKTVGGYFYKINKKGEKKRVSLDEYNKKIKMKGGSTTRYGLFNKPSSTTKRRMTTILEENNNKKQSVNLLNNNKIIIPKFFYNNGKISSINQSIGELGYYLNINLYKTVKISYQTNITNNEILSVNDYNVYLEYAININQNNILSEYISCIKNGYVLAIFLFVSFKKDIKIYEEIIKFIKQKISTESWQMIKKLIENMINTSTTNNTKKTKLIQILNSNSTA